MLPHPYIRDADLYRQLFTYLEQLEDPVRLRNPGAEAKPNTGDAALNRQLSTYPWLKNKMILIQEMLLLTDNSPNMTYDLWLQKQKLNLILETLLFTDNLKIILGTSKNVRGFKPKTF